jgi:hypothetical protein
VPCGVRCNVDVDDRGRRLGEAPAWDGVFLLEQLRAAAV